MAQPEEPTGIMPETLDTVRDALRTMTRRRQKGGQSGDNGPGFDTALR
jgi:hypothetical protein